MNICNALVLLCNVSKNVSTELFQFNPSTECYIVSV